MQPKTRILIAATLISIYLAIFFSLRVFGAGNSELQVSFLDIGQGDSIYIKAPNGKDMLIDGGRTSGILLKKLRGAMSPGDNTIDVVMATHPDADHIGGLQAVIENVKVGEFIEPGIFTDTKTYAGLLDALLATATPHMLARTGTTITLDEKNKVIFSVLAPSSIYPGQETNEASIIGLLSYGEQSFMLTGDAYVAGEEAIMIEAIAKEAKENEPKNKNSISGKSIVADVLKLGHHGSRTSSSEAFLRATQPGVAVISAGCKNSYGHPHKEVVDRLAMLKIPSISTCDSGTITFTTDGVTLSRRTEK